MTRRHRRRTSSHHETSTSHEATQSRKVPQHRRVFYVDDELDEPDDDDEFNLDFLGSRRFASLPSMLCSTDPCDGRALDSVASEVICTDGVPDGCTTRSKTGVPSKPRPDYRRRFSLNSMYSMRPSPERHSKAKAILTSTAQLEQVSRRIRNELWHAELIELAVEAEKAAESGLESFSAKTSTYGHVAESDKDGNDTSSNAPYQKAADFSRRPKPARLQRNHTYSEGVRIPANPSPSERRKVRVTSLRDINEVFPQWRELHVHVRTHLARRDVDRESLSFSEASPISGDTVVASMTAATTKSDNQFDRPPFEQPFSSLSASQHRCLVNYDAVQYDPAFDHMSHPPSHTYAPLSVEVASGTAPTLPQAVGTAAYDRTTTNSVPTLQSSPSPNNLSADQEERTSTRRPDREEGIAKRPADTDDRHGSASALQNSRINASCSNNQEQSLNAASSQVTHNSIVCTSSPSVSASIPISPFEQPQLVMPNLASVDDDNSTFAQPTNNRSSFRMISRNIDRQRQDIERVDSNHTATDIDTGTSQDTSVPRAINVQSSSCGSQHDDGHNNALHDPMSRYTDHSDEEKKDDYSTDPPHPSGVSSIGSPQARSISMLDEDDGDVIDINSHLHIPDSPNSDAELDLWHQYYQQQPSLLTPRNAEPQQPNAGGDFKTPANLRVIRGPRNCSQNRQSHIRLEENMTTPEVKQTTFEPSSIIDSGTSHSRIEAPSMPSIRQDQAVLLALPAIESNGCREHAAVKANYLHSSDPETQKAELRPPSSTVVMGRRLKLERGMNMRRAKRSRQIPQSLSFDHVVQTVTPDDKNGDADRPVQSVLVQDPLKADATVGPRVPCADRILSATTSAPVDNISASYRSANGVTAAETAVSAGRADPGSLYASTAGDSTQPASVESSPPPQPLSLADDADTRQKMHVPMSTSNSAQAGHANAQVAHVEGALVIKDIPNTLVAMVEVSGNENGSGSHTENLSTESSLVERTHLRCDWETLSQAATWSGKFAENTVNLERVMTWSVGADTAAMVQNVAGIRANKPDKQPLSDEAVLASLRGPSAHARKGDADSVEKDSSALADTSFASTAQQSDKGVLVHSASQIDRRSLYFSDNYNKEFLDNFFYVRRDSQEVEGRDEETGNRNTDGNGANNDDNGQNFWVESCVQDAYCNDGMDEVCNGVTSFIMKHLRLDEPLTSIPEARVSVSLNDDSDHRENRWLGGINLSAASKSFRNLAVLLGETDSSSSNKHHNDKLFQPPGLKKTCDWYKADDGTKSVSGQQWSPDDHHPMAFSAFQSKAISDSQFEAMYGMTRDQFVLLSKLPIESSSDAACESGTADESKPIGRGSTTSTAEATEESSISDMSPVPPKLHRIHAAVDQLDSYS